MSTEYKTPCISARLRRATRETNSVYDKVLDQHGINIAQFSLLRTIQRLDHPTLNTLADETGLDASTLGRNMRVLERNGLIQSRPGKDKRTRVATLTDLGLKTSRAARRDWDNVQAQLKARLGPDGYETLFHLLDLLKHTDERQKA